MADSARVTIDEVLAHFDQLEHPRSTVNRLHSLPTVIVNSILAILAGVGGHWPIGQGEERAAHPVVVVDEWSPSQGCSPTRFVGLEAGGFSSLLRRSSPTASVVDLTQQPRDFGNGMAAIITLHRDTNSLVVCP